MAACELSDLPLFALPVEIRRCGRNRARLIIVSATGEVLLRTLDNSMRDQDIAERFVRAMNEWAFDAPSKMKPLKFGISKLKDEGEA